MSLSEEELNLLFETIEAIIDEKLASDHGRNPSSELLRAEDFKQDCINMIALGEKLEDDR